MALNKSIKKFIGGFFLALLFTPVFAQEEYSGFIDDEAGLLTEEQGELLKEVMLPILEYGNVAFVTNPEDATYSGTAANFAADLYEQNFGRDSGTLVLIDMYNRRIQIYSDGDIYKVINTTRANMIADNVYQYATDENYYECARETFVQIHTFLEGGFVFTPMRYASNFLIAIAAAFFILYIFVYFKRKSDVTEGVLVEGMKKSPEIERENITVENQHSTEHIDVENLVMYKEYKTQHSSSSGGHGGGHGGGGGRSGGGGGHGF